MLKLVEATLKRKVSLGLKLLLQLLQELYLSFFPYVFVNTVFRITI